MKFLGHDELGRSELYYIVSVKGILQDENNNKFKLLLLENPDQKIKISEPSNETQSELDFIEHN